MGLNPISYGLWSLYDLVIVAAVLGLGSAMDYLSISEMGPMVLVAIVAVALVNLGKELVLS